MSSARGIRRVNAHAESPAGIAEISIAPHSEKQRLQPELFNGKPKATVFKPLKNTVSATSDNVRYVKHSMYFP
jgi:hypothetical protein